MGRLTNKDAIHVSPTANVVLTAIFLAEIAGVFYTLGFGQLPPSAPLTGGAAMAAQAAYCAGLFGIIYLIKLGAAVVGRPLSRHLFADDPLGKSKTMHKFQDQMWQLAIHVSMTLLELYVLHLENGTVDWVANYWDLWLPHPKNGQMTKATAHLVYFLQIGIWIDTCLLHRFVEERHKDYILMFTHHLVTIALLSVSYYYNYIRIGVIVLYVHDVTDIVVDLLKIFNYCQVGGRVGGPWEGRAVGRWRVEGGG